MNTEHGLTSEEVAIVKAAVANSQSTDGDYKDMYASTESVIIEALGYTPSRMPEASAAPRAFGRWLSAVMTA